MSKLSNYIKAKQKLDIAKDKEAALRIELLEELFPDVSSGSAKTEIQGLKIKGTFGVNWKVDKAKLEKLKDSMTPAEQKCIRYKPELSITHYKLLDEPTPVLDEILSCSPAMPSIEIKIIDEE